MNIQSKRLYFLCSLLLFSGPLVASEDYFVRDEYSGITAVMVEGSYESVTVNVSAGRNIKVRSSGKVKQSVVGSELQLSTAAMSSGDHVIVHASSGGGSIVVINGVQISGSTQGGVTQWTKGSARPSIELEVPVGTQISLIDYRGHASIGDIQAPFVFKGSGRVTVGDATDTRATLRGNSTLNMASATGVLIADLRGNSRMQIERGQLRKTLINSSGNSHFRYGGWTDRLNVDSKGNSRVDIAHTGFRPRIRQRGNAKVRVNL